MKKDHIRADLESQMETEKATLKEINFLKHSDVMENLKINKN